MSVRGRGKWVGARIHGTETGECGAHCDTGETHLGNGGIDDALLAELVEEALGDLARALGNAARQGK